MKADFSRLNFDSLQHYVGVVHQQGRVWLDSDWNHDVFERLRLLEQETLDIVGGCGVPTPHTGFKIEPAAAGTMDDFVIRGGPGPRGHYYVDGLLAQLEHDTTYRTQPDYPDPPPLDPGHAGDRAQGVVFLEVWQRLITHVEDPTLRDVALGGPDTTGRLKTVAQVKVLRVPDAAKAVTCEDADRLLAFTGGGTLTTLPPTDAPPDDDCEIPDPGSYTGRENRLYRVEVHDAGDVLGASGGAFRIPLGTDAEAGALQLTLSRALSSAESAAVRNGVVTVLDELGQRETLPIGAASGTNLTLGRALEARYRVADQGRVVGGAATFKWSRDNAAFASAVTAMADDRITLSLDSLGRDVITTLRDGDLVEVSDDVSDLGPARGHLTTLVADPEADPPRVTLAEPLPASFAKPGGAGPDRHLKLRRWDGLGMAQATFDPLGTPDLNLGDGIRIQFGGTDLRPGDYWTFAARRADGSVERLDAASPHGIIRHRCPLAIVRWTTQVLYPLDAVAAAARHADLGDVFARIYELLESLASSGTKEIDEATALAVATEAGATAEEVERIREALKTVEGTSRRPRFEVVDDCRRPFDPLTDLACACECTVAVEPGESIEDAVRRVPPEGGTVCLLPGTHDLRRPVTIRGRRGITIRGSGPATRVRAIGLPVAFQFQDCDSVSVRDLVALGGEFKGPDDLEKRRRLLEALGDVAVQPEVLSPALAERLDPGRFGGETEEGAAGALSAAPAEPAAAKPTAFSGLITFVDCRGTTVAGCNLLYAPPDGAASRAGFGLVFVDSRFLQGELATGVRSAVMAAHAAEAAPAAGAAPAEAAPSAAAPAEAAPAAVPSEPVPEVAPAEAPAREEPLEAEPAALAGITALIAAMGDRAPSISASLRREPMVSRTVDAARVEATSMAAPELIRREERDARGRVRREMPEPAPTAERETVEPLAESGGGLLGVLASIDREPIVEAGAAPRDAVLAQPVTEAPFTTLPRPEETASTAQPATGVPVSERPIRVEVVTLEEPREPTTRRRPVDLTLRDCRFFAGGRESGLLVASAIGVTITNDWFLPLTAAGEFGLEHGLVEAATTRTGRGFGVLLVDDRLVTIRDNVISDHTFGIAVVDNPTGRSAVKAAPAAIQVVGNVIDARRGPALWAVSRDADLVLVDNSMTGEPTEGRRSMLGLAPPAEHGATADVTADTVIAIGNRFGCGTVGDALPSHSVGMKASQIIFSSNLSVCDGVPGKANVVLVATPRPATRQSSRAGRITAVSNLCREPRQVVRPDFRIRLEEVVGNLEIEEERRIALRRIVAEAPSDDLLVTRLRRSAEDLRLPPEVIELVDAAEREAPPEESVVALEQELSDLDGERSTLVARYLASEATAADFQPAMERLTARRLAVEDRLRVINAINQPPPLYSLVATAAVAVTGMNVLSHALFRSGAGSDVGTVQNTP